LNSNQREIMKRIFQILFLLSIVFQTYYAQSQVIFKKNYTENLEIKFHPEYPTTSLPNYFIDEIAKALPKIRMYVKINYQYQFHTQVVKKGSKYTLNLKIQEINHGGYFKYKNFDFSHLIAPSEIEQSFIIHDLSSNKKHYQKIRIPFKKEGSSSCSIPGLKGVITFRINLKPNGAKYIYTNTQKEEFQQAVLNIDNYYDDALKLKEIKKRILALHYDEAGLVALRNVDLKYIEKDLAKIHIDDYKESLNLESYDPIRLLKLYDEILVLVKQKRDEMDNKMGNLDQIHYQQAMQELQDGNENKAIELLKKSYSINPYFSPSLYQLALIDYKHKKYVESLKKIQHLLNELKPDIETKANTLTLSKTVYNALMNQCKKLNSEERFNQSIGLLNHAKNFCDSTKNIQCDARLEQYISQATNGLYASYLSIAQASLDKGRLDMCQDYMKMARDYRMQNQNKLKKNNAKAKQIIFSLIRGLLDESEEAKNNGNHTQAKDLLSQAEKLCNENPDIACKSLINKNEAQIIKSEYDDLIHQCSYFAKHHQTEKSKEFLSLAMTYQQIHSDYIPTSIGTDTIEGRVRLIMYRESIKNGLADLKSEKYQYALNEFRDAKKLEEEYHLKEDPNLNSYLQQAAKPVVISILKKGKLKAWGKHYDEAQQLLDSAILISQDYHLMSDAEITNALKTLKEELNKSECSKLNEEYNALIQKANTNLRFEDYYRAAIFWKQAVQLQHKNTHCDLNTQNAQNLLIKYKTDISYSGYIFHADSLKTIDAKKAFSLLEKAENLRLDKSKELHSKKVSALIDILFNYNLESFNQLGINYFLEHKKAEESYKLCILTLESGQNIDESQIIKVAELLAETDKQKGEDAKNSAEKRFGNKKEMKALKKAYFRAWKD